MLPKPDVVRYIYGGDEKYYAYDRKVKLTCNTSGRGLWSPCIKKVVHNRLRLWYDQKYDYHSLDVFFTKRYWKIEVHGLIYTDDHWLKEFKAELKRIGFKKFATDFSEQGSQGEDFVNLGVDDNFAKEYFNLLYTKKELQLGSFSDKSKVKEIK